MKGATDPNNSHSIWLETGLVFCSSDLGMCKGSLDTPMGKSTYPVVHPESAIIMKTDPSGNVQIHMKDNVGDGCLWQSRSSPLTSCRSGRLVV